LGAEPWDVSMVFRWMDRPLRHADEFPMLKRSSRGRGRVRRLFVRDTILILRHQLVLKRANPRPRLCRRDRMMITALARMIRRDRWSGFIVTLATVLRVRPFLTAIPYRTAPSAFKPPHRQCSRRTSECALEGRRSARRGHGRSHPSVRWVLPDVTDHAPVCSIDRRASSSKRRSGDPRRSGELADHGQRGMVSLEVPCKCSA
jgi:hypothetical protein